jgi:hypothetical protein
MTTDPAFAAMYSSVLKKLPKAASSQDLFSPVVIVVSVSSS